eukprot:1489656-Amphidinium_carterae.1
MKSYVLICVLGHGSEVLKSAASAVGCSRPWNAPPTHAALPGGLKLPLNSSSWGGLLDCPELGTQWLRDERRNKNRQRMQNERKTKSFKSIGIHQNIEYWENEQNGVYQWSFSFISSKTSVES